MMSLSYFLFISLIILSYSCGRAQFSESGTNSFHLRDIKSGKRWLVDRRDIFLIRKECASVDDCSKTVEEQRIPLSMYEYRLQEKSLVAPTYRGPDGIESLDKDIKELEKPLSDVAIKPESRESFRTFLNQLQDQRYYLESARLQLEKILSSEQFPAIKDSDGEFEAINWPFQSLVDAKKPRIHDVFIDNINSLIWMPLEEVHANWFDANSSDRVNDRFGSVGTNLTLQRSCKGILGSHWRLPTTKEVDFATQAGIRRYAQISIILENWPYFWTSETVVKETSDVTYGVLATFSHRAARQASRWGSYPVICVTSPDEERKALRERFKDIQF
jgi:hypothetical protein